MNVARIDARVEERQHREMFRDAFGESSTSVVVEVELDDGRIGQGEATLLAAWSGESPRASLVLLEDVLRPALIGVRAERVGEAARSALAANAFLVWAVEAAALEAAGVSAATRPIPVRGLIGRLEAELARQLAAQQVAEGHRRLKVKLAGDRVEDEARLRAVRAAAPDAAIVADANEAIAWEELPAYADVFRETAVVGVEQPCSRTVTLERGLPAADGWAWVADESIWGYDDALTICDGPWHAWTLHPGKCRGEEILHRVAALAAENGIAVVLGSNAEAGPGAKALCRIASELPESELQEALGHDFAGPILVDNWTFEDFRLEDGAMQSSSAAADDRQEADPFH